MITCPVCDDAHGPVIDIQTTDRGQTFYGHSTGLWCITGVLEEVA